MDGKVFAKFAVDCKVVSKECTKTDVDLTFARVKDKGQRKINYEQFLQGVAYLAGKRGESMPDLEDRILSSGGKTLTGTKAENVALHDDKTLYTGVYANGGPSNVDTGRGRIDDISSLCDRGPADVRGRQI